MRWLVLDEVVKIQKGKRALTRSRIPACEYSSEALMLEMMAQTGGMLLGAEFDYQGDCVFTKVENAEFTGSYQEGDPIEISASSDQLRSEGAWIDASITQGDDTIAKSRFMLVNVGQLIPGSGQSITFHEQFMTHFQIRDKIQ